MIRPEFSMLFAGASSLLAALGLGHSADTVAGRDVPVIETSADGAGPAEASGVARAADGLFYVRAKVNGKGIRFLVDTGANVTVLRRADAVALGVVPARRQGDATLRGAGGIVSLRWTRLSQVEVAGHTLKAVEAAIVDKDVPVSLLGQDMLARLGGLSIDGDRMTIG